MLHYCSTDTNPDGELGGGIDLRLSSRLSLKHTDTPFSGLKPALNPWTSETQYYAKGVDVLSTSVSDPSQYMPVGELGIPGRKLAMCH